MLNLLAIAAMLGIDLLFNMLFAVVLVQLWGWFIVPGFEAKPLMFGVALGIVFVSDLLTRQNIPQSEDKPFSEKFTEKCLFNIFTPAFAYCTGWVAMKLFM